MSDAKGFLITAILLVAFYGISYGVGWVVTELGGGPTERLIARITLIVVVFVWAMVYTKRYRKSESDEPPKD